MTSSSSPRPRTPRARALPLLLAAIVALGAIDAWAGRRSYFAGDSVSYVTMAARIAGGDLGQAVNGLWSPLYPIILAAFIRPFEPDVAREFAAVRVANFALFLATMASFAWFLRALLDRRDAAPADPAARFRPLDRSHVELAAWAVFAWACFSLNIVCRVSPDGCVTAIVFASFAALLTLARRTESTRAFVGFGALLGVGYWVKAILLPVGALLVLAALLDPAVRRAWRRLLAAVAALALVASPLALALSLKYGHPTLGESGRLNYAWHVNRVTHWIHWRGGPPGHGAPLHPTRQIFASPDAFAFASPISATYPPWYDPTYFYQGVKTRFDLRQQARAIFVNLRHLGRNVLASAWPLWVALACALPTLLARDRRRRAMDEARPFAPIAAAACGGLAIYIPSHLEARYLPPFLAAIAVLLLCLVRLPAAWPRGARAGAIPLACLLAAGVAVGPRLAAATSLLARTRGDVRDGRWKVAEAFAALGVPRGTPVASIGESQTSDWHRLAWVNVVAEIPYSNDEEVTGQVDRFWAAPPATERQVLAAFAREGARYVVASQVPAGADTAGWTHIPDSEFYFRALP